MVRTIRAETSKSLSAPGTSFERENATCSGGDQELARALHLLSVEHAVDGYTQPSPEYGVKNFGNGEEGEGPEVAPAPGGDGGTGVQGEPAVSGGSAEATVQLLQPLLVGDGEAETDRTKTQQFESGTTSAGGVEAARGSGVVGLAGGTNSGSAGAEAEGATAGGYTRAPAAIEKKSPAEEAEKGDEAIKNMAEKLLRTSSSVALAVARPLSIKPPPVLEVEEDPHQVCHAAYRTFPASDTHTHTSSPLLLMSSSYAYSCIADEARAFQFLRSHGGGWRVHCRCQARRSADQAAGVCGH